MQDYVVYHNPDKMHTTVIEIDAFLALTNKKVADERGSRVGGSLLARASQEPSSFAATSLSMKLDLERVGLRLSSRAQAKYSSR